MKRVEERYSVAVNDTIEENIRDETPLLWRTLDNVVAVAAGRQSAWWRGCYRGNDYSMTAGGGGLRRRGAIQCVTSRLAYMTAWP